MTFLLERTFRGAPFLCLDTLICEVVWFGRVYVCGSKRKREGGQQ